RACARRAGAPWRGARPMPERPRILLVRGNVARTWELRPWELLTDRFDVAYLQIDRNILDASGVRLRGIPVKARSSYMPPGRLGLIMAGPVGGRYLGADGAFGWADSVDAEELFTWAAADAARRKARHGFKLILTIWETIPFLATYRTRTARAHREWTLRETDLFLPTTERARAALLLEGVEDE